MNILGALKKKYEDVLRQIGRQTRIRRQLNMNVDLRLREYLKGLHAELGVPRDIVGEHVLEIGCYYLGRILANERPAAILRRHLINDHLLDGKMEDTEVLLRLGEGHGNISELLDRIEPVLYSWRGFQRAFAYAKRTGNFAPFEAWKKHLMNSVVLFAEWLENDYRDEPGDGEASEGPQDEEAEEEEEEKEGDDDDGDQT